MVEFAVMQQGVLSHNLFGYCGNEPMKNIDSFGYVAISGSLVAIIVVAAITTIYAGAILWEGISLIDFKSLWLDLCDTIKMRLTTIAVTLGIIAYTAKTLASKAKELAESIAIIFAKAKTVPRYKTSNELHHIVAKKSVKALPARTIINKVGIGYNSPKNLVSIKTGLHRRLHSNLYYTWVNSMIVAAYSTAGSKKSQRQKK